MKKILMAAVMMTSVLTGSAHAVEEGGCMLPKKPRLTASAPARAEKKNNCPNGGCVAAVRG